MSAQESYIVTAFASPELTQKFLDCKQKFNLLIKPDPVDPKNLITKNYAHLTLKRPFYIKDEYTEELIIAALDTIHFEPFQITGSKIEMFKTQSYGNIVVILIEKTPELIALHEKIANAIEKYAQKKPELEKHNFNPHFSILYNLPDEMLTTAIDYAKETILPLSCMIDNIYLLKEIPNQQHERKIIKKYLKSTV